MLISSKPGSFIAGADVKMLEKLSQSSAEAMSEMVGAGQQARVPTARTAPHRADARARRALLSHRRAPLQAMDRLEAMGKKKPWVAAIDGPCLGGGLEVALACAHRVASSSSKTVLGVPEVMLGLLPGAGGTQRLPRVVGAATSLDLALTGKQLKAARAKKMGLVDLVVDPAALERTAIATAKEAASGKLKPRVRTRSWMDWFLESTPPGRSMMFSTAGKKVAKQTKGKYPAPNAILDCIRTGIESGHAAGSKKAPPPPSPRTTRPSPPTNTSLPPTPPARTRSASTSVGWR